MRERKLALLLSMLGALVLGFIIPTFVSINALDALIVTFLPVIILFAWVIFRAVTVRPPQIKKKGVTEMKTDQSLIDRIGSVIVTFCLSGFFLGMGIICGMSRNENMIGEYTTTGTWGDILIDLAKFFNINVTGTHLFLLFMTPFLALALWALRSIVRPNVWELKRKAVKLEKKGKLEEAKQLYWKTISMGFPYVFPYERLRVIYAKQGDLKGAVRACEAYVNTPGYDVKKERMKEWIRKYQAKLNTNS